MAPGASHFPLQPGSIEGRQVDNCLLTDLEGAKPAVAVAGKGGGSRAEKARFEPVGVGKLDELADGIVRICLVTHRIPAHDSHRPPQSVRQNASSRVMEEVTAAVL